VRALLLLVKSVLYFQNAAMLSFDEQLKANFSGSCVVQYGAVLVSVRMRQLLSNASG